MRGLWRSLSDWLAAANNAARTGRAHNLCDHVSMGLVAWVALGYVVLLLWAGMLAGSLCRVAKLSARHEQSARGEVVLWGRVPLLPTTAPTSQLVATRRPERQSTRSRAA